MDKEVTVYSPTGEKDKYGKPVLKPITSKARVQFSTKTIMSKEGVAYQSVLDIDLPAETFVSFGTKISYTQQGVTTEGSVILLEDVLNLTGTHVDYRNVSVG